MAPGLHPAERRPAGLGLAAAATGSGKEVSVGGTQPTLSSIVMETMLVPIVGTAPLIVNRSQKAKQTMLDGMQGRRHPKQTKDQDEEYRDALYLHDDGRYGFPVIASKAAAVSAARFYGKNLPMTQARQSMFFDGEFSAANRAEARAHRRRTADARDGHPFRSLEDRPAVPAGVPGLVEHVVGDVRDVDADR